VSDMLRRGQPLPFFFLSACEEVILAVSRGIIGLRGEGSVSFYGPPPPPPPPPSGPTNKSLGSRGLFRSVESFSASSIQS